MKKIKLTKGKYALVDDEDFKWLSQWKWYALNGRYAARAIYLGIFNGKEKYKTILMHNLINKTPYGMETDHIDGYGLNNQKINLRSATHAQNNMNKFIQKNNTSGISGIDWIKRNKKWRVRIKFCQEYINLGRYLDKKNAIKVRNNAIIKYFGEFGKLSTI